MLTFRGSPGPWSLGSNEAKNDPFRSRGLKKVVLCCARIAGRPWALDNMAATAATNGKVASMLHRDG